MTPQIKMLEAELQMATDPAQHVALLNKLIWALCSVDLPRTTRLLQEVATLLTPDNGIFPPQYLADDQANQALCCY